MTMTTPEQRNFLQTTPVMPVPDLEAAIAFFRDLLGWSVKVHFGGYAYVEREGVGMRLMDHAITDGAAPGNRRFGYYVDVRNVDALFAELAPRLAALPPEDVHGPANKPYGQRELCILAPDGNLLVFGQAISAA